MSEIPKFLHNEGKSRRTQFLTDVADEGPPEKEYNPGIASRLPAKTVASGALIQDRDGRILFVVPVYRPDLGIPGGVVDANESPLSGCHREVQEELGFDIPIGKLLVVDWTPRNGIWRDSMQFVFDGGVLTDEQTERIVVPTEELTGFKFAHLADVQDDLKPSLYRRLHQAQEAKRSGTTLYCDFGR